MQSQPEIVIDLDRTREADTFPLNETNLHHAQLQQAVRCICEVCSRIALPGKEADLDELSRLRVHEAIAVFGKRGVGKTSFLLALGNAGADALRAEIGHLQNANRALPEELQPLPIIDPTLMGRKENLLHLLVKHIRVLVDRRLNNDADGGGDGVPQALAGKWETSFRQLGQGIAEVEQMDGPRKEWYDAAIAFERSIVAVEHGSELESELKRFVYLSLRILKKKAFLVFLDDMDMRPDVCWPILECVRKYFTTPQLIPFLAGDLDLFAVIVRNNMLEQFYPGRALDSLDERDKDLVEGLVDQYLLKLIPNRNRITLLNFYSGIAQRMDEKDIYEKVAVRRFNDTMPLGYWLRDFHQALGLHYPNLMQLYDRALFDTPLRTFRQICDAVIDAFYLPPGEEETRTRAARYKTLSRLLADIFQNQLYQFGYANYRVELEALKTHSGIGDLLDKLVANRLLQTQDDLAPESRSYAIRMAFVVIQAGLAAALLEKPAMALHALFKTSLLKQTALFAGYELDTMETFRPLRDYIRLETEDRLYNTGQYLASIAWSAPAQRNIPAAARRPYRFGGVMVAMPVDLDPDVRQAVSILHPTEYPDENCCLISIFSFIGLIADVLEADTKFKLNELLGGLRSDNTLFPFRTATHDKVSVRPERTTSRTANSGPETEKFVHFYKEGMPGGLAVWRDTVVKFLEEQDTDTISAGIFSRIAKRFSEGLRQLDYDFSKDTSDPVVYEYLSKCAVLFLNTVLVEETLRKKEPGNISFRTPVMELKIFYQNILACIDGNRLKKRTALEKSHPLFSIIASFPLWGIFNLHGDAEWYAETDERRYRLLLRKFPLFTAMPGGSVSKYLNAADDFPWDKLEFV